MRIELELEKRSNQHRFEFYGEGLPEVDLEELHGRLIVVEGADSVGRSTQVSMLKPWLESNGHAVLDTGMTRSALAGKGIKQAKEGLTLGPISLALFYATDFADRLENEMIPALRAGFIVLTDRYIYSLIARAIVRGLDAQWIKSVYGLALKPDAIFYLRASVPELVPRVLGRRSIRACLWRGNTESGRGCLLLLGRQRRSIRAGERIQSRSAQHRRRGVL